MTDLEGVAGVINSTDWIYPGGRYYETAKRLLTEEVNAAIRGFAEEGFSDIVVADGHGCGAIDIELLDPCACLMRDWNTDYPYPFGLNHSYDAVAFVGQHAKAGTEFSHLTHTEEFNRLDFSINDISLGEYGKVVLCAGELGIPVLFIAGEKALVKEVEELTPHAIMAAVKEGMLPGTGDDLTNEQYEFFHQVAIHLSPARARESIYRQARIAAESFKKNRSLFKPFTISPPYRSVEKFRSAKNHPAKTLVREHKTSVIGLLNGE
jgi:D-amino peptidase